MIRHLWVVFGLRLFIDLDVSVCVHDELLTRLLNLNIGHVVFHVKGLLLHDLFLCLDIDIAHGADLLLLTLL